MTDTKLKLVVQFFSAIIFGAIGVFSTLYIYQKMVLEYYSLIGVFISIYMIWFYMIKLKRPLLMRHIFMAAIGPFIWPMQISKHIYDLIFNIKKSV